MVQFSGHTVAFMGRLGHGKTCLLNKVCGTHHVSRGGCSSATREVELGYSKTYKIAILGTPGLGATEEVARHVAAQKLALEYTPLSAIFIIVRCGRDGDMIDDQICDIIDMVGEKAVRIIVTHADVESKKEGFNVMDIKRSISRLADISIDLVKVVGLKTSAGDIEDFIYSTLLTEPVHIKLDIEGAVRLAAGSKQSRRISKSIRDIYGKIDAAAQYIDSFTRSGNGGRNNNYENDMLILDLQRDVSMMVMADKENIFRMAAHLTADEQMTCYAQAGAPLSIKLKAFIEKTNLFLSWNVTDLSDPRNHYRACNHCGAVFVKVEGCDGSTTCGLIPSSQNKYDSGSSGKSGYLASFYSFIEEGTKWVCRARRESRERVARSMSTGSRSLKNGAVFEAGCGRQVNWSTMHPVDPKIVAALGKVETVPACNLEVLTSHRFEIDLKIQEELHRMNLDGECKR